ncbi:hypothetical protein HNP47_003239 [Brevundimonas vesicularis]|jgi:hypothetical protein|uniref:Uncharacterized protein n=1 Tax=Brevundimonas vesicularis TaxID=41276 RepID=A0A7W9FXB0_BREVE|nr:hypothetical protein [Brevundimonas vesicularis]MBB5773214.1 hypothetical protein [Brevundimonas vesicularis]
MLEGGLLGWATDQLIKLDDQAPGLIARVLTAAPKRRQAIFAVLAAHDLKGGVFGIDHDLFPAPLAEVIRHGRASDILRHAFSQVPEGFSGLLERIGERPLARPQDYMLLHGIAAGDSSVGIEALRDGRITGRKLAVYSALDERWRHANTLGRIDTPGDALTFNRAVDFVQTVSARATDEVVATAIAAMRPTSTLARLLDRLLRRADRLPDHPITAGDNELRPLASMRDLLEAGRKYRNCLAHRLADVAAGKMAMGEFRGECLVEFRPLTQGTGWLLRDVHIERNRPVPLALIAEVEAKCDQMGIHRIDDAGDSGWKSYRRFTAELEWG